MNDKNNQLENVHYPYRAPASPSSDTADSGLSRREFLGIAAASMFLARAGQEAPPTEPRNGIPYRILGRTREKVSLVGLGGYHLGKQAFLSPGSIRSISRVWLPAVTMRASCSDRP